MSVSALPLTGVKVDSAGGAGAGLGGAVAFTAKSPGRGGRGVLLFPEICLMELQLLASGSPDLEVLGHVFHSLLGAVRANPRNAALLYHQVIMLATSHPLYHYLHVAWIKTIEPLEQQNRTWDVVVCCMSSVVQEPGETGPSVSCLSSLILWLTPPLLLLTGSGEDHSDCFPEHSVTIGFQL